HLGDWREAQTVRRGYELNVPTLGVIGNGTSPVHGNQREYIDSCSFLGTDCPHVVVETVKPAEDGDGLIVRLYEAHNQRGDGALIFATSILSAQECNLLEEPINDVSCQGNTLSFQVRPFEIKTFRVHLAPER